jgi:hypothetical protein
VAPAGEAPERLEHRRRFATDQRTRMAEGRRLGIAVPRAPDGCQSEHAAFEAQPRPVVHPGPEHGIGATSAVCLVSGERVVVGVGESSSREMVLPVIAKRSTPAAGNIRKNRAPAARVFTAKPVSKSAAKEFSTIQAGKNDDFFKNA